jgi:hypothetical protein
MEKQIYITLYSTKLGAQSLKQSVMDASTLRLLSPQRFCQKLTAKFVGTTPCRPKRLFLIVNTKSINLDAPQVSESH